MSGYSWKNRTTVSATYLHLPYPQNVSALPPFPIKTIKFSPPSLFTMRTFANSWLPSLHYNCHCNCHVKKWPPNLDLLWQFLVFTLPHLESHSFLSFLLLFLSLLYPLLQGFIPLILMAKVRWFVEGCWSCPLRPLLISQVLLAFCHLFFCTILTDMIWVIVIVALSIELLDFVWYPCISLLTLME